MLAKLKRITIFDAIVALMMTVVLIITVYPFLQVVAISFNDATDTVRGGIHIIPRKFTFQNYISIFESNSKIITGFINSI